MPDYDPRSSVWIDRYLATSLDLASELLVAEDRLSKLVVVLSEDVDATVVRERLAAARPPTLGHVRRVPGVTPAAVNIVAAWLTAAHGVRDTITREDT